MSDRPNKRSKTSVEGKAKAIDTNNSTVDNEKHGFYQADVLLKAAIQPVQSVQPLEAVQQQLNHMLFKFNPSLDGVPLVYSDIKFPKGKNVARIMGDSFWLHIDINTKLLLFKPTCGKTLEGKISKVGSIHNSSIIRCLRSH